MSEERPEGPDISKWQATKELYKPHGVDLQLMWDKADFLIVRAGYGGSGGGAWKDERVDDYMEDLIPVYHREPKPFTFYWYLRDDVDLENQAIVFSNVINAYQDIVNLPPICDAEIFTEDKQTSTDSIALFCGMVLGMTGKRVDIIYGRALQLNENTVPGLQLVCRYLHVARYYSALKHPWGDGYCVPRDWEDWAFWQYTKSGPGKAEWGTVSISIDLNYANMTLTELRKWAGLDQEKPKEAGMQIETVDFEVGHVTPAVIYFIRDETYVPKALELRGPTGHIRQMDIYFFDKFGSNMRLAQQKGLAGKWTFVYNFEFPLLVEKPAYIRVNLRPVADHEPLVGPGHTLRLLKDVITNG